MMRTMMEAEARGPHWSCAKTGDVDRLRQCQAPQGRGACATTCTRTP